MGLVGLSQLEKKGEAGKNETMTPVSLSRPFLINFLGFVENFWSVEYLRAEQ